MSSPIGTPSHDNSDTSISIKEQLSPINVGPLYEGKKEPEAKIVKSEYLREQPLDKIGRASCRERV